jgi:hypothetical protein
MENFYGDVVNMLKFDLARKFVISQNRFVMTDPRSGRCATPLRCRGDCRGLGDGASAAVRGRVPSESALLFGRVGCGLRFPGLGRWVLLGRSVLVDLYILPAQSSQQTSEDERGPAVPFRTAQPTHGST